MFQRPVIMGYVQVVALIVLQVSVMVQLVMVMVNALLELA